MTRTAVSRTQPRPGSIPPAALLLLGTSLLFGHPAVLRAESHYTSPGHNCRADQALTFPLQLRRAVRTPPSRGGWYLRNGDALVFVGGESLLRLDLGTLQSSPILDGLGPSRQLEAGLDSSRLYVRSWATAADGPPEPITLSAFSTDTYKPLWSVELSSRPAMMSGVPLPAGGRVVVPAMNRLFALDTLGRPAWTRERPNLLGSYAAAEGDVLVITTANGIEALSMPDGGLLWRRALAGSPALLSETATIAGGTVYLPAGDRTVAALDLLSGSLLWESAPLPFPIDIRHPVIVHFGGIVVPGYEGLAMLDTGGRLLWSRTYPFLTLRQTLPAVLAAANAILVGGKDGLYAVSLDDGEVLWSKEGLGEIGDIEYADPGLVAINSMGTAYEFMP